MQRFHRAMSLTLLALASLILVIELFRAAGLYPRMALVLVLALFLFDRSAHFSESLSQHSVLIGP